MSSPGWPECSKYYHPETMDAERIRWLLHHDTSTPYKWAQLPIDCIDVKSGEAEHYAVMPDAGAIDKICAGPSQATNSMKVILLRQRRENNPVKSESLSNFQLKHELWLSMLQRLDVLPSFLRFLYSNSGGSGDLISFDEDHKATSPRPSAYHICVKGARFSKREFAVYARHDFQSKSDLIIVAGLCNDTLPVCPQRLSHAINTFRTANIFNVLHYIQSAWFTNVHDRRMQLDFETNMLESRTGYGGYFPTDNANIQPLPVAQLTFSNDLQDRLDQVKIVLRGAGQLREMFCALSQQLKSYDKITSRWWPEQRLAEDCRQHLQTSISHKAMFARNQLLQIEALKARIESQIAITKTLITQRDVQSNLALATAMKRDSQLMRGIALVTMIFLPATSVATFFSMVFFQTSSRDSSLEVSNWIWLYPTVTVPMTLMITVWYVWWSSWSWGIEKLLDLLVPSYNKRARSQEILEINGSMKD